MQAGRIIKCIDSDAQYKCQHKQEQIWDLKWKQKDKQDIQIGRGEIIQRYIFQ